MYFSFFFLILKSLISGAHTIGQAQCSTFRTRIYNENNIDSSFAKSLQANCPSTSGDSNLSPLDATSPNTFDTAYFVNLQSKKGVLHSDQELFNGGSTDSQVNSYSSNPASFRADFANAMVKMGNLSPLTGSSGQIRTNCRNTNWDFGPSGTRLWALLDIAIIGWKQKKKIYCNRCSLIRSKINGSSTVLISININILTIMLGLI